MTDLGDIMPGSLGWEIANLRMRAEAIGYHAISAGLDQLDASMRDKRDEALWGKPDRGSRVDGE